MQQAKAQRTSARRRRGFTLIQLLIVVGVMAALAALIIGAFGRSRLQARHTQCDVQLKATTMALDAFRQENGYYPADLNELVSKKYITDPAMLKCPNDPRANGSYNEFYVMRSGHDSDELPMLVCPLCKGNGTSGLQAFKGRYTKQFSTRPAELIAVSGASVMRPGKAPLVARVGMLLRGGDGIQTAAGGSAILRFADGSTAQVSSASEITVLESFIAGNSYAPLYTVLRQKAGDILYKVHHGSKFDVTTPTATAGALGTEFRIKQAGDTWYLKVIASKVYCSNGETTEIYTPLPANSNFAVTSSTTNSGSDDSPPVTQTNNWIPLGQVQTATNSPSDDGDSTTKKKMKKSNSGSSNSNSSNSNSSH